MYELPLVSWFAVNSKVSLFRVGPSDWRDCPASGPHARQQVYSNGAKVGVEAGD